jgi:hypothetical protein
MTVFARERGIKFISPMFSIVSPEKSDGLVKQLRGIIFPEDKYDQMDYVNRAMRMFERMRGVELNIKPV